MKPANPAECFAIGLGSNLGDRLSSLRYGLRAIGRHATELVVSGVYETEPVGYEDQGAFLNACCVGCTRLSPRQLLSELQDAERRAGRERSAARYGPRTLDLDVLLYGDRVLSEEHLIVPHPRLHERAFVLVPLSEIAPDWIVPAGPEREAATVAELAQAVDWTGVVRMETAL